MSGSPKKRVNTTVILARAGALERTAQAEMQTAERIRIYYDSPHGMTPDPQQVARQEELRRIARQRTYAARQLRSLCE